MKNILLALISFFAAYTMLFQVAYAQSDAGDGWPPRGVENPPAATVERGSTDDRNQGPGVTNATVPGKEFDSDFCEACASNIARPEIRKNTLPKPAGSGNGGNSSGSTDQNGSR